MAQINWTIIALLVIGLFALMGFIKGWWKEAVTTVFLAFLAFLLQVPAAAQFFINLINGVLTLIWKILPNFVLDFLNTVLKIGVGSAAPQLDAGSSETWLVMLVFFIGLAILVGRFILPGSGQRANAYYSYIVTWPGALLGGLLGALNGWLIISLARAYIGGIGLPGHVPTTSAAANSVRVQTVNMPTASILDSFLPWIFVGIGLVLLLAVLRSRVVVRDEKGFKRIDYTSPLGYQKTKIIPGG